MPNCCLRLFCCCKKRKDKKHKESQNEKSSVQHSDKKILKSERKWKDRKGSQNKKLLPKHSDNPERQGIELKDYEEKNQKHYEERKERERLERELEESENEKAALKINHKEEMGALKNELRDLEESLKKKLEESEHEIKKWKDQYNSLVQEKRTIEEEPQRLRSAEAKINQLTRQLEDERKANKEAVLRKSEEYMNEKSTLEQNHQEEIKNLEEEIKILKERTKEQEQMQHKAASTEQKEKDLVKEEYKKKLDNSENEKEALKISHKEEIGALNEQIRKLQNRLTIDKSSYEKREKELKTKCDDLEADITSYKENWTKSEDTKIQLDIKIMDLEEEKKKSEGELKRIQAMYNQLRIQFENERKDKEDAVLRLQATNNQLTKQLDSERKAKEDALLRLSSMASNKLRDNNPNIADLSDPNRPTKLSEQFSELYDNEWTDAFDELEKLLGDKEDKEIISYLRDFLLEIHSFCSDISSSKLKSIEEAFVKPSVPSDNTKIPTVLFKTIKDGIKSMASNLLEHTRECVLGHLKKKYLTDPVAVCLQHQNVKRYIDKCTEICWYMSVQDPQLVMDGSKSPDEKFDSNKHREYTKKGPYEEFVVWPVLYLYKGGQMLSKGVAQGTKKEMNGQQ